MKIIENKFIPFKGYKCITLLCFIFTRDKSRVTEKDIQHETIHWEQEKEMLILGFYLWYIIEFLIRFLLSWNWHYSYKSISFEQEAYEWEGTKIYLSTRKHYNWLNYMG